MRTYSVIIEAPALGSSVLVQANDEADAVLEAERQYPGWKGKIRGVRRLPDQARRARLLEQAERFIAGFEGDPMQDVDELLGDIREELGLLPTPVAIAADWLVAFRDPASEGPEL